jgi:ribosomal protein S18 acetylase RimI-like enzyme
VGQPRSRHDHPSFNRLKDVAVTHGANAIRELIQPRDQAEFSRVVQLLVSQPAAANATIYEQFLRQTDTDRLVCWLASKAQPGGERVDLGAIIAIRQADGVLNILAFALANSHDDATAMALFQAIEPTIASPQTPFAQYLNETSPAERGSSHIAGVWRRAGFKCEARLDFKLWDLLSPPDCPTGDFASYENAGRSGRFAGQTWRGYRSNNDDAVFAAVIEQTYRDSLDCPALACFRSGAQALTSHQATGLFRHEGWVMLQIDGEAAGLLLLNEQPEQEATEIVYMGIVPAWRGKRLGQILLAKAATLSQEWGRNRVLLAVDSTNLPAARLYEQAGFRTWMSCDVWLRFPNR